MTDEQAMARIKSGQLNVLNELFERYGKRLYNYFLKSTLERADSDDLTQELFIRVMKYRMSYKEGERVESWLFQIARNMIKDHYKKMKIHKSTFNVMDVLPEPEDAAEVEKMEQEKKLYQAMKCLPDDKRELLVLSKFEGLKYEQIAQMRCTSVANIKVQVHRTIKELRTHFFDTIA